MRGDFGLPLLPRDLKAKQGPCLRIGAGERGGKAFPDIGGQGVGIAHHQNPRRGKKPLEREDLPEFGRQFVVAPENMPLPSRIGMGTKKLLHLLAEELPVWAYAKAETRSCRHRRKRRPCPVRSETLLQGVHATAHGHLEDGFDGRFLVGVFIVFLVVDGTGAPDFRIGLSIIDDEFYADGSRIQLRGASVLALAADLETGGLRTVRV